MRGRLGCAASFEKGGFSFGEHRELNAMLGLWVPVEYGNQDIFSP